MRAVEKLLTTKRLLAHLSRDYAPVAMYQSFCAEDIVLAHLIFSDLVHTEYKNIHMFAIDTGRTSDDIYLAIESMQKRYGDVLTLFHPDADELAMFDTQHGFGVDYYQRSVAIRYNKPLSRALAGKNAWISTYHAGNGVTNKEQRLERRLNRDKALISWDNRHQLPCFNPVVRWTEEEIINYAKHHSLPLLNFEGSDSASREPALARYPAAVALG